MRKSQYYVDIKWGYLKFEHKTTERPRPKVAGDKDQNDTPVELFRGEYEKDGLRTGSRALNISRNHGDYENWTSGELHYRSHN